jgi:anti-sigma-K factor RskA
VDWADTRDAWNRANDWRAIASSAIFALATLAFALRLYTPPTRSAT